MKDRHEWTDKYGRAAVGTQPNGLEILDGADGLPEPYQNYRANAEILRLAAEVERLRDEREWRPIETAPKNGTEVLLWCERRQGHFIGVWDSSSDRWKSFGNTIYATHWMPMPEPPDEVCG